MAVPVGLLFGTLTLIGVVGNLIVILAIAGDSKMRRSVMNILLLNLAIADLCNLVIASPEWISPVFFESMWFLPSFMCSVCRYLECVFLYASIFTQIIVCIERYVAIALPMQARRLCSRRNVLMTVAGSWLFVAAFASPYASIHSVSASRRPRCLNVAYGLPWWSRFKFTEFIAFYFVPCIIFVFVYSKIARILWSKDPSLTALCNPAHTRQRDSLRTRRNVVKMLIFCVAVYFICYSPIQFLFISSNILGIVFRPPYEFILLMNALAMTCSASNPLLYTLFSTNFRKRLWAFVPTTNVSSKSFSLCSHRFGSNISQSAPLQPLKTNDSAKSREQSFF
ncbi:unnamed protein product [Caenorhabditis auriculariae]|uniref:G-protein coupled receptors family 1 profile domain-containing protein n=1 Tax=Caenorhabditis auriculariae TaxID=2777116 RepID=A0A8S1GW47_9PELO|nr:unnamed protein product [Caenorhabditis auriculariae]